MPDRTTHWETVYQQKAPTAVSWYSPHLDASLKLLEQAGLDSTSRIIDVGGGASTLVDDLIERGVADITVLDLSAASLGAAQTRLGTRTSRVTWLVGDIIRMTLSASAYTHWHDRAVMHFLAEPADVQAYAAQVDRVLAPGGYAVIGGFAPDGPERCSGLPVARRSAGEIAAELGSSFVLVGSLAERHQTPGGVEQSFVYALLRKTSSEKEA
ncbi:class I SAM-dependent methyltransferase [Pseudoxanthomonas sp. UTMC 1351]|uniref:class I SAM-dependent methyltransferase n=1 Tax=Pseudoxanthomonas sp. UTMC 1351 TaxID=2695853 RepID=UPI0034CEB2AA